MCVWVNPWPGKPGPLALASLPSPACATGATAEASGAERQLCDSESGLEVRELRYREDEP